MFVGVHCYLLICASISTTFARPRKQLQVDAPIDNTSNQTDASDVGDENAGFIIPTTTNSSATQSSSSANTVFETAFTASSLPPTTTTTVIPWGISPVIGPPNPPIIGPVNPLGEFGNQLSLALQSLVSQYNLQNLLGGFSSASTGVQGLLQQFYQTLNPGVPSQSGGLVAPATNSGGFSPFSSGGGLSPFGGNGGFDPAGVRPNNDGSPGLRQLIPFGDAPQLVDQRRGPLKLDVLSRNETGSAATAGTQNANSGFAKTIAANSSGCTVVLADERKAGEYLAGQIQASGGPEGFLKKLKNPAERARIFNC